MRRPEGQLGRECETVSGGSVKDKSESDQRVASALVAIPFLVISVCLTVNTYVL